MYYIIKFNRIISSRHKMPIRLSTDHLSISILEKFSFFSFSIILYFLNSYRPGYLRFPLFHKVLSGLHALRGLFTNIVQLIILPDSQIFMIVCLLSSLSMQFFQAKFSSVMLFPPLGISTQIEVLSLRLLQVDFITKSYFIYSLYLFLPFTYVYVVCK